MYDEDLGFDPEELLKEEIIVDKLDAARRQIETAITMFFEEGDVISQHTLISAAWGIVYDLAKKQGIAGSLKDAPLDDQMDRRKFIEAIHLPQNFFKHAKTDIGVRLAFRYRVTHFFFFDAIRLFVLLHNAVPENMRIFLTWFQLRYVKLLCFPSTEEHLSKVRAGVTDPEIFKAIGRKLLRDLARTEEDISK